MGKRPKSFGLIEQVIVSQSAALALRAKENQRLSPGRGRKTCGTAVPVNVIDELAKIACVSRLMIQRVQFLLDQADEATLDKLRQGRVSIHAAYVYTKSNSAVLSQRLEGLIQNINEAGGPQPLRALEEKTRPNPPAELADKEDLAAGRPKTGSHTDPIPSDKEVFRVGRKRFEQALKAIWLHCGEGEYDDEDSPSICLEYGNNAKGCFISFIGRRLGQWAGVTLDNCGGTGAGGAEEGVYVWQNGGPYQLDGSELFSYVSSQSEDDVVRFDLISRNGRKYLVPTVAESPTMDKAAGIECNKPGDDYFEPPVETRQMFSVSAHDLLSAVERVTMATDFDGEEGARRADIQIELYGHEPIAYAGNTNWICWSTNQNPSRKESPDIFFQTDRLNIIDAIYGMGREQDIQLEVGQQFVLLRQPGRWQCIPNTPYGSNCFRKIIEQLNQRRKVLVYLLGRTLHDFVELARANLPAPDRLIIDFDTRKREVSLAACCMEKGILRKSGPNGDLILKMDRFEGDGVVTVMISWECFEKAVKMDDSLNLEFRVIDAGSRIQILGDSGDWGYVMGVSPRIPPMRK